MSFQKELAIDRRANARQKCEDAISRLGLTDQDMETLVGIIEQAPPALTLFSLHWILSA